MWRKVLNIISWAVLASYLVVSLWFTGQRLRQVKFHAMVVNVTDSVKSHFVSPADVAELLARKGIATAGSPVYVLNRDSVQRAIRTLSGVKEATVYTTPDGTLFIDVSQRTPVMRYVGPATSFYIDNEGREMPLSGKYTARVLVVTGQADRAFLRDSLFQLVREIRSQPFLDALVEGIVVSPDHELELVPRVGEERIFFGDAGDYGWKLTKLKVFYEKGLPNVGWDRYSGIDLRYSNQVVARLWSPEERKIREKVRAQADSVAAARLKEENSPVMSR
jgi:cell division protein FtsQ